MRIRRVLLLAGGVIAALSATGHGQMTQAQSEAVGTNSALGEVYVVHDVAVDVTGETAAAARDSAYAQGHAAAMRRLLARILPRDEWPRVPPLETAEIAELVANFDVADERTSQVRYLANLTFRFNPEAVRAFLREHDIPHAETRSKPVLVLPVSGARGVARLWEDPTPWFASWAARPPAEGLVPLIVPLGDLADIAAIDAEQALAGEVERLSALARRYGAEDVLVTQAIATSPTPDEVVNLQISTSRFGREPEETIVESLARLPGESLEALYARAAALVADNVQERWKRRNLLHPGDERTIRVSVALTSLADWLEIKRRLRTVAGVKRGTIARLSRDAAAVDIRFVGDERQLTLALAQRDLDLLYSEEEGWRMAVRGAAGRDRRESGIPDEKTTEPATKPMQPAPPPGANDAAGAAQASGPASE